MTLIKTLSAALLCSSLALPALAEDVPGVSSASPSNTTSAVNDRTTLHAPEVDRRILDAGNVPPNPNIPTTANDRNPNLSSQANADRSNINAVVLPESNVTAPTQASMSFSNESSSSPAPVRSSSSSSNRGRPNARQFADEQRITRELNNRQAEQ